MSAQLRTKGWSRCQPLECQASSAQLSPQKQGGRSATDLLQSYIDRFNREGDSVLVEPAQVSTTKDCKWAPSLGAEGWEKARRLPQPSDLDDDRDTFELLCGHGNSRELSGCQKIAPAREQPPVSLRARRILQDVDRQLGHMQPCYSAPDKLDLRTMWPSMHDHLDRRWRQQLRARYEVQQSEKATLAARDAACQGSRAGMYGRAGGGRPRLRPTQAAAALKAQEATSTDRVDDKDESAKEDTGNSGFEDDDGGNAKETGSDCNIDGGGAYGATSGSLVEAARSVDEGEQQEVSGQRWGSDSGVGLSCVGGSGEGPQPAAAKQPEADSSADYEDEDDVEDRRSFEERMRSYRCVLEAHELSEQLRQRLQVACASGGGPRVLSTDQKGLIRERLASLQHPGLAPPLPAAAPSEPGAAKLEADLRQQERITTERLANLMSSARVLLAEGEARAAPTCGQLLCGGSTDAAGGRRLQQQASADNSS